MLAAPLSLAYAPDIYTVAPPHRDARNLTAANAFRAGADSCTPNADHGCLDGTPYDYDTQFVCGSHTILKYSEEACCEQGRPFDTSAECAVRRFSRALSPRRSNRRSSLSFGRYCCTGSGQHGTHSYNDGKCDLSPPDQCACYDDAKTNDGNDAAKSAITAAAAAAAPKPAPPQVAVAGTEGRRLSEDCLIDVSSPPEGGYQCTGPAAGNDGMGCFNGWCVLPSPQSLCPQNSQRNLPTPLVIFLLRPRLLPQAVQLHDALPGGHVAPLLRPVRRVPVVAGLPSRTRSARRARRRGRSNPRARCPPPRRTMPTASSSSTARRSYQPSPPQPALRLPYTIYTGTAARSRARRRATTTRSRPRRASATATAAERLAWPSTVRGRGSERRNERQERRRAAARTVFVWRRRLRAGRRPRIPASDSQLGLPRREAPCRGLLSTLRRPPT